MPTSFANLRLSSSAAVGIATLLRPLQHSIAKVLALIIADTSSDKASTWTETEAASALITAYSTWKQGGLMPAATL